MSPDISALSVEELERLRKDAESLIASKREKEIESAYNELFAIAKRVGMSLEELLEVGQQKKKTQVRKPVAPRYRNKANASETWTGRGKKPRWLATALAKGAKLEDFLI